jgi:hypothetical protein
VWSGKGSLLGFIVSLNVKRRHLTPSQRAALAIEILPALEDEARTRQRTSTGGKKPQLMEKVPEADKGTARAQAAKLVGVNERYVAQAKRIQAVDPELLKRVLSGDKRLVEARRLCAKAELDERVKKLSWGSAAAPPSILPLEALWSSPRKELLDFAARYPNTLERAFREFRKQAAASRFDDAEKFPDRVMAAAREMDRVLSECLEMLSSAADIFADQCVAVAEETSDVKIPLGAREQRASLIEANRRQKNYEGWCAELGCWAVIDVEDAAQSSTCGEVFCPEHANRATRSPKRARPPVEGFFR